MTIKKDWELDAKQFNLDSEETQILKDYEDWKFIPANDFENQKKILMKASKNTSEKLEKKWLYLNSVDKDIIDGLKKIAEDEGLPYQVFIKSILYKVAKWKINYH